jgi:hypothetical protein
MRKYRPAIFSACEKVLPAMDICPVLKYRSMEFLRLTHG